MPFASIGCSWRSIAEKNGIASRVRMSGAFVASRIVSVLPRATTPLTDRALPSSTAWAPTMSATNGPAGDCCWLFTARSIAHLKLSAVTAFPFENLKPGRIVNV